MNCCWNAEQHVAVAVSGGVDSMVLLDQVRTSGTFKTLSIVHVNHGQRAESAVEQQMIEHYAATYGIPCYTSQIPSGYFDADKSIQQAARDYRYQFFDQVMTDQRLDVLLTAHHRGDQLETIAFRLLTRRFYMQPLGITDDKRSSYQLCRPLKDVSKSALRAYAETHAIPYMEDASNSSTKYARNAIRHELLPTIDAIDQLSSDALIDFADWHADVLELIALNVLDFSRAVTETKRGYRWAREAFNQLNHLVKRALLVQLIESSEHESLALSYLDEIIRVAASDTVQVSFSVTSQWNIEIAYDKLMVHRVQPLDDYLEIQSPGKYLFNDYEIELTSPTDQIIIVRLPQPHDKIKVGNHHQKVNRIMINDKVPDSERIRLPIVEIEGSIVAVGTLKRAHHPIHDILIIKGEEQHA